MNRFALLTTCLFLTAAPSLLQAQTKVEVPVRPQADQPAAQEAAPGEADGPVVTLLEAGAEPRTQLRLAIKPGLEQEMEIVMDMSMTMSMGGQAMPPQNMPTMRMRMRLAVTEQRDNGDYGMQFELTEAKVDSNTTLPPMAMQMMEQALASMEGMRGTQVITNRGFVREVEVEIPPNADPMVVQQLESMKQSLRQMCAPMPDEPVGPGGAWKVDATIVNNGINVKQSIVYTLRDVVGTKFSADVAMTQTADEQPMEAPGIPKGSMTLKSLESDGTGRMALDLSNVVPVESTIQLGMKMQVSMDMAGMPPTMDQTMTMKVKMSEAKPRKAATKSDAPGADE